MSDLEKLLESETPLNAIALTDSVKEKENAGKIDPAIIAREFVKRQSQHGLPIVRRWRGAYYLRCKGRYTESPDEDVRNALLLDMKRRYGNITSRVVSDVMMHLSAETALSAMKEPHTWIAEHAGNAFDSRELICTRNKILHLPSLHDEGYKPLSTTPAFFNLNATDFSFVPRLQSEEPETWTTFLGQVLEPDEIRTLQQWFGLCLTMKTNQQKILVLIGAKRSGKGTIARVLNALVGQGNVAGPTLSSFSQQFGLQPLIGKQVAIVGDARMSNKGASVVVERMLSISGEDQLTIDRKYREPWTGTLSTRLMILSNELPRLADASGALASRMIVLTTRQSFFGREDLTLSDKLEEELSSIFWWAVDGYADLISQGRLHVPTSSTAQLNEMERLSSPEKGFLDDYFEVTGDSKDWIAKDDLYSRFKDWCESEGINHKPSLPVFAKNAIAASGQRISSTKRTDATGQRFPAFKGLRLKSKNESEAGQDAYPF